ncbi:uncharacterized protein NECHADRAFT_53144 [Fusarium vanettenii 77-13-4]|uniref:Capsule polysaccharide biosynthesis protein n=1 Tax=Fusarium vanettenii (strain ATCC MYA-4622 / CBS 123669 / FGSC 9596 / NRRL 45880 / 77-13-4) TaxID=660122 RepID=C7ZIR2_FUSV7|nr:uncharacterized protein NECHADRAFT_53144 [Fusarium vanettenii 77-13-4]EEU36129.1 hypothetical protein NECHADRAFT_53144 [Fusarium vanettenii 77-13-4]
MATYSIPEEFTSELELVDKPDTRSTKDILAELNQYKPVTSEKNIWAFWHAGLDAMPSWCQRNVADWVRICGPSWTVRVLDVVPDSPNHALKFASQDLLPDTFVKGTMDGPYVGPHSMDFLRGALLFGHGGVAIDVGCVLLRSMDRVCWDLIMDPKSPIEVADIDFSEAADWPWDFKIGPQHVLEYVSQVMCWRRLAMLEDAGDGFNGSKYWQENILGIDARHENWAAEDAVGFGSGARLYELFNLRVDSDPETADYKEAYNLVWLLLRSASWQKVTHGKGLTHAAALGTLWDENDGKDSAPGTFGELLRWGSVHLIQKREAVSTKPTAKSALILQEGLYGPSEAGAQ